MRIGLIGYGNWGKAHARTIKTLDNAELVAISAPSDESRKLAQQEHGVPVYADYHEMLKRSDLDVIDIVAPNYLHQEMATAALQSGRDIILEKPMAAGSDACNAILKIARSQKKHITICHESRYSPLWGGVKKLIDDGKIGEPRYLLVELWRRPFRPGSSGWKQDPNRVLSWFLEEPIHFFDLARWYFSRLGEPTRVFARGSSKSGPESSLNDNMSALVDFPGGAYALISQSIAAWGHSQTIKVTGTKGALVASWSAAKAQSANPDAQLTYFDGTEAHEVPLGPGLAQEEELAELIHDALEAFRSDQDAPITGIDGRASVTLCEASETSIRSGAPVELCWS